MDGGWPAWWAVGAVVVGLVVLGIVGAVVARRASRAERELARFRSDVRSEVTRLRSALARRTEQAGGVGRIPHVPSKGV